MTNETTSNPARTTVFEAIKRRNQVGTEFWSSRDLATTLGYADYRNFEQVITKAKAACFDSGRRIEDHFVDVTEMVDIGVGAQRAIPATFLSRYACYLIIQSADAAKEVVGLGQTFFTVQARRREPGDEGADGDRQLILREEMRLHNVRPAGAARDAGVVEPNDYAVFLNHGYQGLYGAPDVKATRRTTSEETTGARSGGERRSRAPAPHP